MAGSALRVAGEVVALIFLFVVVTGACFGADASVDGAPPVILLDREVGETRLISFFDAGDLEVPKPVDLIRLEPPGSFHVIGLFNGMLYGRDGENRLVAIDIRSGARFIGKSPLAQSWNHEDGRLFEVSGDGEIPGVRVTDLRARSVREFALPAAEEGSRWLQGGQSHSGLQRFYQQTGSSSDDGLWVPCRILDLHYPEAEPVAFDVILPVPAWRIDGSRWPEENEDTIALVEWDTLGAQVSHAWLGDGRFACTGLGVVLDGVRYPAEATPGAWHLFVVDLAARSVEPVPLASLVAEAPAAEGAVVASPGMGGGVFRLNMATMTVTSGENRNDTGIRRLGEHFTARRVGGRLQVGHRNEPLKIGRDEAPNRYVLDRSETRVLLRGKAAVCYDIYYGYYAEATPKSYYNVVERCEFMHDDVPPSEGWVPLLAELSAVDPLPVSGILPGPSTREREDRATCYAFQVSTDQAQYAQGAPVTLRFSLTSTADTTLWTEPPSARFPMITGTLCGPVTTVPLSRLPGAVSETLIAPVRLAPGETLEQTLVLEELEPGDYTLAAAYGGNPSSDWRGLVPAPLVLFRVGDSAVEAGSRLRYVVEKILQARNSARSAPSYQELERSGSEGVDMVVTVLREVAVLPEEADRYASGMGVLYNFLYNRRSTELLSFYLDMLKSPVEAVQDDAELALRYQFRHAKDEAVRSQIRAAVVALYADAAPGRKAYAMENYAIDAWPDLFERMKIQAVEGDYVEQRQAVSVLCSYYLKKFDVFEGEFEQVLNLVLRADDGRLRHHAVAALGSFYGHRTDLPAVQRAIDQYRVAYPEAFDQKAFFNWNDLWDMAWLERAAEEPTEARFALIAASRAQLESHCGSAAAGFPDTWASLEESAPAQAVYAETLQGWAACLRDRPATFRVPVLQP